MRRTLLALIALLSTAAAAAGYVHSHHHLLGQTANKEVELALNGRGDKLEEAQGQSGTPVRQDPRPPAACNQSPNPDASLVLAGKLKSYAFGGIPEDCRSGYGCNDRWYWGQWCRYGGRHKGAPQCPVEMQEDLQSRLRSAANDGHSWAEHMLTMRPCEVFPYLEGRTMWIIGDSMSKDFAFAFQCFMLEYWDEKSADGGRWPLDSQLSPNVSSDPQVMLDVYQELSKIEPGSERKPWYLQWCIPMYKDTRMCYLRANEGQFVADSLMPLLPRLATPDDLVLLNFGLHSNDNGTLYGYIKELKSFASMYEKLKPQLPQFIWRQTSPQHFTNLLGEWHPDKPIQEQSCSAIPSIELDKNGLLIPNDDKTLEGKMASDMTDALDTLMKGGRRNVRSAVVLGKAGIPIMHIWNTTLPLWDFHRFYHDPNDGTACAKINCDCTHTCSPSWHPFFLSSLRDMLVKIGVKGSARLEEFNTEFDFPIPGMNVPLKYVPWLHNVSTDDYSVQL